MEGVVYVLPVNRLVPPVDVVYQLTEPPVAGVALSVTVPDPQRLPGVVPVIEGK